MNAKEKKIAIIVGVIIAAFVVLWAIRSRSVAKVVAPKAEATDAQDAYYMAYNNPPVTLGGSPNNSVSNYDLGDIRTSNVTNVGAGATELSQLANTICGCVSAANPPKCSKGAPQPSLTDMFNSLFTMPAMPPYMSQYVAPEIPSIDVITLPDTQFMTPTPEPVMESTPWHKFDVFDYGPTGEPIYYIDRNRREERMV